MKDSIKTAVAVVAVWALSNWAWDKWGRAWAQSLGIVPAAGAGAGAGASGGAAGGSASSSSSSSSASDYAALAAAIAALAAGVQLPNIESKSLDCTTGDNELVAGEGGKRICVLAYGITAAGAPTVNFRSGNNPANRWRVALDSPAGNSGANMATSWPGYLFATDANDKLNLNTSSAATVAVTFWREAI